MKSFAVALLALLPAALAQQLTVSSPSSVVECEPVQLSWNGGTAPYFLSLIPGGQASAPAIKQFPTQSGTSYTWLADLPSGTTFTISLKDSSGSQQYSSIITIQNGTSTSCVNTSVQESGTAGSSGATAGGSSPSGTSGAATTGGASTTGGSDHSSGSGSATATSSGSSSSSTAHSAAGGRVAAAGSVGLAGLMGLVGATLF